MNRGDQREVIFRDDEDRQKFLSTLGEACGQEKERLCWDEDPLRARPQGHRMKLMLSRRLRQKTAMSLQRIAECCKWALGLAFPTGAFASCWYSGGAPGF